VATNIKDFLTSVTTDSKFFLNLPVFWTVTIDGVQEVSINSVLENAGEKWRTNTAPILMTKNGNILVAQEVTLPQESSIFTPMEIGPSMGGYLPGYGMNNRSNFLDRQISINFLETQTDIEHNFFRPWMIAVGIKGLISYGVSLKATIEVKQFSNNGEFIKGFRFKKVFPTSVESYKLNYENTDIPIKSVSFGFQNYEQLVGNDKPPIISPPPPSLPILPSPQPIDLLPPKRPNIPVRTRTIQFKYNPLEGRYLDLSGNPLTGNDLDEAKAMQAKIDKAKIDKLRKKVNPSPRI
jgi:hypothetical protein